jgi:hypothetical protein
MAFFGFGLGHAGIVQRQSSERTVFLCGRSGRSHVEAKSAVPDSGHEEADEACDTEEKEDNDRAINRAKPGFFRVVGRNERSIENTTLPAHVVSNPSHAVMLSMAWATAKRGG